MPRIRPGQRKVTRTWQQTIIDRIKQGRVVPIISKRVTHNLVLGGDQRIVESYRAYTNYPLQAKHAVARVAQFTKVVDDNMIDPRAIKEDYINFVKNQLFDIAEKDGIAPDVLAELEETFDELIFSEFSERLGYPRFDREDNVPLLILADLPLPIYITTDHHAFIEVALRRAGKKPRTEICYWHKGLERVPSVFSDESYQPTPEEPLVYHLHGFDSVPESLVLTEDDYMEFLMAVSQNLGRDTDPIPRRVRQAMADSSLVMLGYSLRQWDFKVVFWGLIKPRPLQQTSVSVQLEPSEIEKKYYQKYLEAFGFKVFWGEIDEYIQELSEALED
jgi:hypothetical protein